MLSADLETCNRSFEPLCPRCVAGRSLRSRIKVSEDEASVPFAFQTLSEALIQQMATINGTVTPALYAAGYNGVRISEGAQSGFADNVPLAYAFPNFPRESSYSPPSDRSCSTNGLFQGSFAHTQLVTEIVNQNEHAAYAREKLEVPNGNIYNMTGLLLPDVLDEQQQVVNVVDQLLQMKNGKSYMDKMSLPDGYVMERIHVPYPLVGLVVGLKGANIKRIQKEAQTFIVTPAKDKEPIFVLIGLPDNVQQARRLIELHIEKRTHSKSCVVILPPLLGEQTVTDAAVLAGHGSDVDQQWSTLLEDESQFKVSLDHVHSGNRVQPLNVCLQAMDNPRYYDNPWPDATNGMTELICSTLYGDTSFQLVSDYPTESTADTDEGGPGFDVVAWIKSELLDCNDGDPEDDFPSEEEKKRVIGKVESSHAMELSLNHAS